MICCGFDGSDCGGDGSHLSFDDFCYDSGYDSGYDYENIGAGAYFLNASINSSQRNCIGHTRASLNVTNRL